MLYPQIKDSQHQIPGPSAYIAPLLGTWFRIFWRYLLVSGEQGAWRTSGVWFFVTKVWIKSAAPVVPSFSMQWKSDESTKHYITQILLAINWCYWQAWKIFTHAYVFHWNPPGFRKKEKSGTFLTEYTTITTFCPWSHGLQPKKL